MRALILISLCVFFLFSCENPNIYQKYSEIPDSEWKYENKIPFRLTLEDTFSYYDLYFHIRHRGNYPFSNIWIIVYSKNPKGQTSFKRYEFTLAAPDGKWFGYGLGDIVDHKILMEKNLKFEFPGVYEYTFQHDMRMDIVPSIMDIGMSVTKTQ